jgi:DNA-binding MarR family transcriptional regulator
VEETIRLVNKWGEFARTHPGSTIEDFCRHYLATGHQKETTGVLVGGVVPAAADALLMKIIGRISKLNMFYANLALEGTGLHQIEEFGMLVTIKQEKSPKKTEVIYSNLFELSSGTDMLTRMKKRGLIKEYADTVDKRSKRLQLTSKGEKAVEACKKRVLMNAAMLMKDLGEDDKQLCIQLLKDTEIKFSAMWQKHRGKKFEEIYQEITGKAV